MEKYCNNENNVVLCIDIWYNVSKQLRYLIIPAIVPFCVGCCADWMAYWLECWLAFWQ